jgi:hypothetical protein
MSDAADTLRAQQLAFAAHVRDPATHPAPAGIEDRRLAIYRDLFFNGLEGLLRGNFPVIVATLGSDTWRALVRSFYAGHRCTTPLFTEIGREFVAWLQATRDDWLPELAHYEWIELALQISEAAEPPHDPEGDLRAGIPVASALAWPLAYRWPVHRIGPAFLPDAPPSAPTLLLARRDSAGDVRFSELSAVAFRLLQRIDDNADASGDALLRALAVEAQAPDLDAFLADGVAMLQRLRADGVLLGTSPQDTARAATLAR